MWRVLLASLPLLLVAPPAWADAPDGGDDVAAAQAELDREVAASETNDCAVACRALESMKRAAEHLCALDPGDRCADARAKVERASARVRAACPECAKAAVTMTGQTTPPPPSPSQPQVAEAAPAKRGGCAGCAVGEGGERAGGLMALAAAAAVLARRKRRPRV